MARRIAIAASLVAARRPTGGRTHSAHTEKPGRSHRPSWTSLCSRQTTCSAGERHPQGDGEMTIIGGELVYEKK
jgi:hypothetical protein